MLSGVSFPEMSGHPDPSGKSVENSLLSCDPIDFESAFDLSFPP